MKNSFIKKITKTITVLSLIAVVSTPAAAAVKSADPISGSNTVTTNKNTWVTSMQNYKVSSIQQTSVKLINGNGHDKAVNRVKVGAYIDGQWQRVMSDAKGEALRKDDKKHNYALTKTVAIGKLMRIRLMLDDSEPYNSGFSTDTVTTAWWWN